MRREQIAEAVLSLVFESIARRNLTGTETRPTRPRAGLDIRGHSRDV